MTRVEPRRLRGGRPVLLELGLAVLVAAVSWLVAVMSFDLAWSFLGCSPAWIWLLSAGQVLLALMRLRFPAFAFVCAAALFGLWPAAGGVLALTAFHAAGRVRPERRLRITIAVALLADVLIAMLTRNYGWTIVLAGHAVALLLCVGLPIGVHALFGKADRLFEALRERAHYLEDNYRLAESAARLQERSRIAQEMHDQLGHRLSLISLYAGALELAANVGDGVVGHGAAGNGAAAKGPAGAEEARLIRGMAQTAMRELRATLGMLRSGGPAEVPQQPVEQTGTRADLALLVAQSRAAGVSVDLTWHGEDLVEASLPVRRAANRLVREGLTNIHRHAPGASAEVVVDHRPGRVRIEIVSGRPSSPDTTPGTGLGLIGVQERVRLLGGTFRAGAVADGGFRMQADLPLSAPDEPRTAGAERRGYGEPGRRLDDRRGDGEQGRKLDDRRGITVVLAVGLAGLPALISVLLNGVSLVVPGSSPYDQATDVRIGMTQAEFVSANGEEDPILPMAAKAVETPVPIGSTCLYAREQDDVDRAVIRRYCFHDDRLAVVDEFPVGWDG